MKQRQEKLMARDELIDLEESGWRALSSTGQAAAEFYEWVLDDTVLMLLPGGMVVDDRSAIVESMSGQPWSSFQLEDMRVLHPTADVGVVAYGVVARREGSAEYSALISTSYVRRVNGWKLTLHQQTLRLTRFGGHPDRARHGLVREDAPDGCEEEVLYPGLP